MKYIVLTFLCATLICGWGRAQQKAPELKVYATTSARNWNGIAVSNDNRVFANFPRFDHGDNPSLVEVHKDGTLSPFPGDEWNNWKPGKDTKTHFISLNALYINRADNHLWVIDPGAPFGGPNLEQAAKLVEINLATNKVVNVYLFNWEEAPQGSHLNDIRIEGNNVYVTESGTGALLVLNRKTRKIRRLLAGSELTKADSSVKPRVGGQLLCDAGGKVPVINADQIELSPDGKTLYFMSPFGPDLYRVATADLLNAKLTEKQLESRITIDRKLNPVGGIIGDKSGNLYLSEIETSSIRCEGPDKKTKWIIRDPRLVWPDAYSIAPDGTFYVVVAQIDKLPFMNQGVDGRKAPYYIFTFRP